jgi:hypothetical protein
MSSANPASTPTDRVDAAHSLAGTPHVTPGPRPAHGWTGTRLFECWSRMRYRCSEKDTQNRPRYYDRGIRVCPEWQASFEAFRDWALDNGWAPGLTIDRRDNDRQERAYSPENCRWTSWKGQARNRRDNIVLDAWGERKTVAEWAEDPRAAAPRTTLYWRARRGWDHEAAIATPSLPRGANAAIARRVALDLGGTETGGGPRKPR